MDTTRAMLFVRCADSEPNPEHRFVGQRDVPLSPAGERSFAALCRDIAEAFRDRPPVTIFCSDLKRSIACADMLRRAFRPRAGTMPVVADPGFREISFGAWEGLTRDEVEKRWLGALSERARDVAGYAPAGGESFALLQARVLIILARARIHTPDGLVAVVGHEAFNQCALADCLALPLAMAVRIPQPHGAVSLLEGR